MVDNFGKAGVEGTYGFNVPVPLKKSSGVLKFYYEGLSLLILVYGLL
jgi:hypothetical protein